MSERRGGGGGGGRIFPRFSVDEDVDREIRAHLEMRAAELEASGWEPTAAREEAVRLFGDRDAWARRSRAVTESHHRAVRRGRTMDDFVQDLKYAARTLRRSPGFTAVALITLALGIGANTAIFSVVNGILLRPLPFDRPEELVWIHETRNDGGTMSVAFVNAQDWQRESTSFVGLAMINSFTTTVLGGEDPVRAELALVGEDYWKVFPTQPVQGRLTNHDDHVPGAAPVMVVSRSFWQNQLGARPLDQITLETLGLRASVVGVVPDGAGFPGDAQMWTPAEPTNGSTSRTSHNWDVVARIGPGVSIQRAREEVDAIQARIAAATSDEDADFLGFGATTIPLVEEVVGDVRQPLYLLLGAAALVLLVACTNLASTLLARGTARERELAVRASVGAGQSRIARQLLTESLLLAGLGAAAGIGLAWLIVTGIRSAAPSFLPRLSEVGMDAEVLVFAAVVAFVTALLFGLLPARRLSRADAGQALRSGGRGNAVDARSLIWKLLVGTEVALALVLLAGSALLVRSLQSVLSEQPGFDGSDVEVMAMSLSQIKYASGADHGAFYDEFLAELQALPGVAAAGVMSAVPIVGGLANGRLDLDNDPEKHAVGGYVVASAGAFEALDIPLLQGRLFDQSDQPDAQQVAIVSRSFAEQYWPDENPLGKSVTGGGMDNFYDQQIYARVIGVVGDVRARGLERPVYPTVYFPYTQRPFRLVFAATVVVETAAGTPSTIVPALRDRLRAADPDVPIRIRDLQSYVSESLGERRFVLFVLGGFSVVALILAGVGIFGVVSYSVARRTREMGIRIALGAEPASVLRMVMGGSMRVVMGGLAFGLLATWFGTRALTSLLYGVTPTDPLALLGAALVLGGAGLLASWWPARGSTRVDPMITMRSE